MIERTRAERLSLQRHIVKCWQAVPRADIGRGADEGNYNVSEKQLRVRARALVRHCLDKPVTADG